MYDNDYLLAELIRIKKEELDREMRFKETYKLYSDCDKNVLTSKKN
ncbi:hypothetical protein [Bacillus sp. CECT 9360]|nr:hypothetical protein [Bacillus sp. CECT 9360]CAH0346414.1 hypothetical protein BCI9360_02748 [Bacillus sp. CECT 9360]